MNRNATCKGYFVKKLNITIVYVLLVAAVQIVILVKYIYSQECHSCARVII